MKLVEENEVKIKTNRLVLREIKDEDGERIAKLANNLLVAQYLLRFPQPYTLADALWFINHAKEARQKPERVDYHWAITFNNEENAVLGVIGLHDINRFEGNATIGYWLGEEYWRKRIMSEAAHAVIDFAFNNLNLRRIDVNAVVENQASNALIRKLNFRHEGVRIQKMVAKATNKIHDLNEYGLLKNEWKKH